MQKNECVYEVSLMKQEFVDVIDRLQESTELLEKLISVHRRNCMTSL